MKPLFVFCLFQWAFLPLLHAQQSDLNYGFLGKSIQPTIERLKKAPATAENLIQLGDLYSSKENYNQAQKYFEQALKQDRTDLHIYKVALTSERLKKYPKALELYFELWNKDTLNNLLQYRISKLQMRLGQYQKAFKNLESLKARDPEHPIYPYQMGLIETLDLDYSKAINYFLEAYDRDSLNIDVIYQLANSYNKLKIQDSTALFISRGLKLDPVHKNLNRIKINKLNREEKYEEAIVLLLQQDSLYPYEYFNTKMLGLCYYKTEAYEEAAKWFRESYRNNPEDFNSWTYLGHIAKQKGDLQKARFNYLNATQIAKIPRDEEYIGLGNVSQEMGDLKQAMEMYEKAYNENTNNDDALFEWALASDRYYKDKKIGYNHYKNYLRRFSYKNDSIKLAFIKSRMGAIKEKLFLEGIELED